VPQLPGALHNSRTSVSAQIRYVLRSAGNLLAVASFHSRPSPNVAPTTAGTALLHRLAFPCGALHIAKLSKPSSNGSLLGCSAHLVMTFYLVLVRNR